MKTCDYCGAALTRNPNERRDKFAKRRFCGRACATRRSSPVPAPVHVSAAELLAYARSDEGRAFIAECRRPRFGRDA